MVAYGYKNTRGTVAMPEYWEEINTTLLYDAVSTSDTHTNMSWMAVIASDPEVQQALPQIFRASRKKFPQYLQDYADASLPENIEIWLAASMWSTQAGFLLWLHTLSKSVEKFKDTHSFILIADASKTHINEDIACWLVMYGIVFILLPGGLTWLLQPLDVYVFGQWKMRLRSRLQRLRLESVDGQIRKQQWLDAIVAEVNSCNTLDHAHYFKRLGLHPQQTDLKLVENEVIKQADVAANPPRPPTPQELAIMLGRVNVPFYENLMRWFEAPAESTQRSTVRLVNGPSHSASSSSRGPG